MKPQEYSFCVKKSKQRLYSTIRLLWYSVVPFWRISAGRKQCRLLCQLRSKYVFHVSLRFDLNANSASGMRLTPKSIRYLLPADILQNSAMLNQRRLIGEWNCCFLCAENVYSSLHKIQIEPLIADGVSWRCFSFFIWVWNDMGEWLIGM